MLLAEERPLHAVVVLAHQSPSKTGFCFAENASKARRKSLRLHEARLGPGLRFDRLVDAHVPFEVQHLLGQRVRERRAGRELAGELHAPPAAARPRRERR